MIFVECEIHHTETSPSGLRCVGPMRYLRDMREDLEAKITALESQGSVSRAYAIGYRKGITLAERIIASSLYNPVEVLTLGTLYQAYQDYSEWVGTRRALRDALDYLAA